MAVIREELLAVNRDFGDERRTEMIATEEGDVVIEDLIPDEEVVVTLSHQGYVKTQLLAIYQAQHRGGRGKSATAMKEEDFKVFFDFIEDRFPSNSNFIRDEIIAAVDSMLSKTLKKSVFYFRFDVDIQISIKGIFEVLPIGEEEDSPLGFEGEYTLVEDYLIRNNPNFKSFGFSSDSYFSGSAICPLRENEIIYFRYST